MSPIPWNNPANIKMNSKLTYFNARNKITHKIAKNNTHRLIRNKDLKEFPSPLKTEKQHQMIQQNNIKLNSVNKTKKAEPLSPAFTSYLLPIRSLYTTPTQAQNNFANSAIKKNYQEVTSFLIANKSTNPKPNS